MKTHTDHSQPLSLSILTLSSLFLTNNFSVSYNVSTRRDLNLIKRHDCHLVVPHVKAGFLQWREKLFCRPLINQFTLLRACYIPGTVLNTER